MKTTPKKPATAKPRHSIVLTPAAHAALLAAQKSLGSQSLSEAVLSLAPSASHGITVDLSAITGQQAWFAAARAERVRPMTCTVEELVQLACKASGSTPGEIARRAFIGHCTSLALEMLTCPTGETNPSLELHKRLADAFSALQTEGRLTISQLRERAGTNYHSARLWLIEHHPELIAEGHS